MPNRLTLTESLRGLGLPDGLLDADSLDQFVTRRQMIDSGLVLAPQGTNYQGGAPAFFPVPVLPGDDAVVDAPATPSGLIVTGAATVNILQWDPPGFKGFAYTEIHKNSTDNIGTAVLARTTVARVAADSLGAGGITRYYWIRHVNQLEEKGPFFQAVSGQRGHRLRADRRRRDHHGQDRRRHHHERQDRQPGGEQTLGRGAGHRAVHPVHELGCRHRLQDQRGRHGVFQ
jgi:hypothetical protein